MATEQFFVSHEGEQQGPCTVEEIVEKVKAQNLTFTDYIYDDEKGDWVLLLEHKAIAEKIRNLKPKAPPKPQTQQQAPDVPVTPATPGNNTNPENDHLVTEWYVLKGENRFGPFVFTDVIKMLQEKVVFEFDFVWHPGMSTWQRIADLTAFTSQNIEKLKTTLMPEISEVFFRRRHRRVKYGGTILVHDNQRVWRGKGVEISAGGVGIVIENAMLVPGQTLYLHFKPGDGVPPFNAICEVVSKKYVDGVKDKNSPIKYGLKFKSISNNTQKFLQEFSKRGDAAA